MSIYRTLLRLSFVFLLFINSVSLFADFSSYYPDEYVKAFNSGIWEDEELKNNIFSLLTKAHNRTTGSKDTLSKVCNSNKCIRHKYLSYKEARYVLFGKIDMKIDELGNKYLVEHYCRKTITENETRLGKNTIPDSTVINCEHTWPKSKFNRRRSAFISRKYQLSDLHHLYTSDSVANSTRSNNHFGEVQGSEEVHNCSQSRTGRVDGKGYFEPPTIHKGNVARALFYFSTRYNMKINDKEEEILRNWHKIDPVDDIEKRRNDIIENNQGNRNPFIDYPQLADDISDF